MGQSDVLVVIPARGGSKGIARKNLRILDGRPLLWYTVQAALNTGARVVVSTDDEEIAELAARYGADVVRRSAELAADDIPLDPVVLDVWRKVEASQQSAYQWVVTVQPTSPLVSSRTILRAVRETQEKQLDCCMAVADARHLYWQGTPECPEPAYVDRVNRQWLPPFWRETGALVVTRRQQLQKGIRIGGRVGLFVMPPEEDLDIDSYDDWAVAECRLQAPHVAFRVVGNRNVGLGHAYRCLSLAYRLFTPTLDFYVDVDSDEAARLISLSNYPVYRVSGNDDFVKAVRSKAYTLVINDVLDTEASYIRALRGANERVVANFEDLGSGAVESTVVINELYEYSTPLPNQYFGWQYACLRDEFLHVESLSEFRDQPRTLLITFGGADPLDLTTRLLRVAAEALTEAEVQVVVGLGNPRLPKLKQLADELRPQFADLKLHTNVRRMSSLMAQADLAVTSNGRTVFELASLAVPMITISQNARELTHTFGRISGGTIDVGLGEALSDEQLKAVLVAAWSDSEKRKCMRNSLMRFDLRAGVDRVIALLLNTHASWRRSGRQMD